MRKILVFFVCVLIAGLLLMTYNAGKIEGIRYTIHNAEMFVVDLPNRNEYGGFDEEEIVVYLVIDGEIYEYGCDIC